MKQSLEPSSVIPAKAGIQERLCRGVKNWVPAFAGTTDWLRFISREQGEKAATPWNGVKERVRMAFPHSCNPIGSAGRNLNSHHSSFRKAGIGRLHAQGILCLYPGK